MTRIRTLRQQWLCSIVSIVLTQVTLSQTEGQLSFLFVGDVMQHGPQINGAYNEKLDTYEYDRSLQFVKPLIQSVDIAVANLEITHAGKPYKGYPQFSAPDELSGALKRAGFDVILTSNNHSCDGGSKGVTRTLDVLDDLGIKHTGTFRNQKERDAHYPLIVEQNGIRVAILNYTYGTNGLSVPKPLIINYIDSAVIKTDMKKAREKADYIICTMHWGTEYQPLPGEYQKNWEKYCYELGADMVIGSHPHVVQPVERKEVGGEEKLTAWSLGNFVSNQRDRYKNGGLIVTASIEKNENIDGKGDVVRLKEAHYWSEYVHTVHEGIFKTYYILPEYHYEQLDSSFIDKAAQKEMQQFFSDTRTLLAKHGKGVTEMQLNPTPEIDNIFQGYYSVLVGQADTKKALRLESTNSELMHTFLAVDGTKNLLSGVSGSREEAELNRQVLKGLGEKGKLKIVYVSLNELKILEE